MRASKTPAQDAPPLTGFVVEDFEYGGVSRPVYWAGQGPGVLVMHEIPGITPQVARFAKRLADRGFTVAVPWMLGTPGKRLSTGYLAASTLRECVSAEFAVLARHRASPITEWLRPLGRRLHERAGGPGIGAVGMCLTGNFALSLVLDDHMLAPVLSQPSLPVGLGKSWKSAPHCSPEAMDCLKRRALDEGLTVLGLRFSDDSMAAAERFEMLRTELGAAFEGIEVPSDSVSDSVNPLGPHSVLTTDLRDVEGHPTRAALDRVLGFLDERLSPRA